jgi:hypothetical protein
MRKLLWVCGLLAALPAMGGTLSFEGYLNEVDANDVVLLSFTLASTADVDIQTWGYGGTGAAAGGVNGAGTAIAPGGFDPYASLFSGTGSSATFIASADDGACPPGTASPACHDATLHLSGLLAGDYTLAIGTFGNMSFAENYGGGTLGDGFIGLGSYDDVSSASVRSAHYAVDIRSVGIQAVPEATSLALLGAGLLLVSVRLRRS